MNYLGTLDYAVIGSYLFVLVVMGFYLQKKASASMDDYFLAGKSLPWWAIGISGMGWSLDITGTMLIVSLLYILGPRGLFVEFRGGVPLGLIFVMAWTGKWHRRSNCMTGAEWQAYRFGPGLPGSFARVLSAVAGIVFTLGMLAYLVKGVGLFLSTFIPVLTPLQCSLIMVGVATLYTVTSGFYGVVYSDIFQAFLIFAGIIVVTVIAVTNVSSGQELAELSGRISGNSDWMTSLPQIQTDMPRAYEMYECLLMFTMFLVLRNLINGFASGNTPQYFAAKNERECGRIACLWSSLLMFRWPMMIGYAILGLYLVEGMFPDMAVLDQAVQLIHQNLPDIPKAQWPDTLSRIANNSVDYPQIAAGLEQILGGSWRETIHMLSFEGGVNAEKVLPAVLLHYVPVGFKGLILVTLIAASMSTFDSTINLAAPLFTRDIYQTYFRPKSSNKELLTVTYIFTVLLVATGFLMGYTTKSINEIWGWVTMGLGSGLAVPGMLRLYWWRFNGQGFAIGTFAGMAAAIIQKLIWPELAEQWQFVILTIISLTFTIAGTYMTKPTDRSVLENFYKTTRPFGLWGPFRDTLPPTVQTALKKENRNSLVSLPFIFVWMISLYMMPMQLMIRDFRAFGISLIFFAVAVAGIFKFWVGNHHSTDALEALEAGK
ncbi:Na(+)/glucose symporter [Limihaloglobus sulfuriphilus]|uniref:Na(+)/glucose symporter n=1 Tax=Limihaloglobus sulfuriphilus TaxID=1851148 RepID=A0A1Q2MB18_9BACT|nr:hypothetical protein [Limihaloglobus sulfuriphilus]AQQ69859.1 Na(+)/glucose symporter [Limihaloglobus sulfuriphilus]